MPAQFPRKHGFRISATDQRGRPIGHDVAVAAEAIGARAIKYANTLLGDPALAANLLEESAAAVSRVLSSERQVRVCNLESYLFRAFIRRVDKVKRRELKLLAIQQAGRNPVAYNPDDLESKILINELLTRCDPVVRDMFVRRVQGFPWKDIGKAHGISAHAAESRFSHALQRIRRVLGVSD